MNYTLPEDVKIILEKFSTAGFKIYIVGGAVRDLLMQGGVKDWDFTTDAKPEEILKVIPEGFYDNKFGTIGIPVGNSVFEITTMRKEGLYKDFRHPVEVSWTDKIEEDLSRRDFTINAMALRLVFDSEGSSPQAQTRRAPLAQGKLSYEIIDPFNGQQDIKDKIIRAVGNPDTRFKEDALRLIRAIRIATELEFDIDEKTHSALKENAHLIKEIANERIRDELFKILASMNPHSTLRQDFGELSRAAQGSGQAYIGIIKLREAGILQIILPELERCFGLKQEGPKHDRVYDIGEHSLLALKHTPSQDSLVRFTSLLHDVGKPDTFNTSEDGNVTFYQHDVVGGQIVRQIAKRLNLSKKHSDKLFRLVRWHLFTVDERQTDSALRRFIKNVGVENIDDMMALRVGDRLGGGTKTAVSWRMKKYRERISEVLKKPFSISDLKVNGDDVMEVLKIKPGPKVGEILQKLFEEVLDNSSKNNREYLIKRIKEI